MKKKRLATFIIILSILLMGVVGGFSAVLEEKLHRSLYLLCFAVPMASLSAGLLLSRGADIDRYGHANSLKTVLAFVACFCTASALVSAAAAAF